MKKLFFAAVLIGISFLSYSQPSHPGFLFKNFEDGRIIFKTGGQVSDGRFNYDTVEEKVLFVIQDTVIFELDRPDIVSELKIRDRTFEHAGNGIFYERIAVGDHFFYIRWLTKMIYDEKEGGYGTRPATGAIDQVNQISGGGGLYKLKTGTDYRFVPDNIYYLKSGKGFKRFASFDVLAKQFKNCKNQMKLYVENEHLDFKALDDVTKAVAYGFENCK
jgi:hypothetical protein